MSGFKAMGSQDLPGFYYDSERRRYFPLSSQNRHASPAQENTNIRMVDCLHSSDSNRRLLQLVHMREVGCTFSPECSYNPCLFQRQCIEAQTVQPEVWSYKNLIENADGVLEKMFVELQTADGVKRTDMLLVGAGNNLQACRLVQCNTLKGGSHLHHPKLLFPQKMSGSWPPHIRPNRSLMGFTSRVTAIKKLGNTLGDHNGGVIFTTLGSAGVGGELHILKLRDAGVQSSENDVHPLLISTATQTDCSVWTTAWCGPRKATLGTSKGAMIVDLERSCKTWLLHSKSDVFSQQCDSSGNISFCGFRNGCISVLDIRSPLCKPIRMFCTGAKKQYHAKSNSGLLRQLPVAEAGEECANNIIPMRMQSAVCSMVLLSSAETYLLASSMSGDIKLWDQRLPGRGAVLTYEGNNNSHTMLQLWVDASNSIFASGGEDCKMRIWSLMSGRILETISGLPAVVKSFSSEMRLGKYRDLSGLPKDHAWEMWLGSSDGLLYMQSAA